MVAARLVTTEKHRTVRRPGHDAPIGASSQAAAATALKVSTRSVQRAQTLIATKDTDAIASVDSGDVRVSKALRQVGAQSLMGHGRTHQTRSVHARGVPILEACRVCHRLASFLVVRIHSCEHCHMQRV